MSKTNTKETEKIEKKKCGIIMPISSHPDYPKDHWNEVLNILTEAISKTEFEPRLVSDDVAIGLIHERIVNNIYNDDIVVCDVSSKNPNVMFELGMRLAFDKPTIIIKDEKTGYSFDTGVIEHLSYPSSLRFNDIVRFKESLITKINATYERSQTEPNFSPFLKTFGNKIVPAKIQQKEIAESQYIINMLSRLSDEVRVMRMETREKSIRQERDLSPSVRRRLIYDYVDGFISANPHIDEEDLLVSLMDIIKSDIKDRYGFTPSLIEIDNVVSNYLKTKEKKDVPF